MRTIALLSLFIVSLSASLPAMATDVPNAEVLGRWASETAVLNVTEQNGQLHAHIIALKDPLYTAEEQLGPVGTPRLDDNNPDASLRERPVLGMDLLVEYRHSGKRWEGKIYDPESGNTYSSRMKVDRDGNLAMRGYIGTPLLGRTAIFVPVSTCQPAIKDMLAKANLTDC
ncbi:MAG: DUF2147 domain-containing protein [Pseudomonadota bacterium]